MFFISKRRLQWMINESSEIMVRHYMVEAAEAIVQKVVDGVRLSQRTLNALQDESTIDSLVARINKKQLKK